MNAFTRLHAFPDIWFYSGFLSYLHILILFHLRIINCYANRQKRMMKHTLNEYMPSASLENMNFQTIPLKMCRRLSGTNILNTCSFEFPVLSSHHFSSDVPKNTKKHIRMNRDAHIKRRISRHLALCKCERVSHSLQFWIGSRFVDACSASPQSRAI